ncbi:hypothetical protein HDU93_000105 [Gonapodya sp. JEL0774]|nr:hypothetical protein HDU93_000105 [Gonapodya sp. JEL0774]
MAEWAATDHPGAHRQVDEMRAGTGLELVVVGKDGKGAMYYQVAKGSTRIYKETKDGRWSVVTTTVADLQAFALSLRETTRSRSEQKLREEIIAMVDAIEEEQRARWRAIEEEQKRLLRTARTAARLNSTILSLSEGLGPRLRNPRPRYVDPPTSDIGPPENDGERDDGREESVERGSVASSGSSGDTLGAELRKRKRKWAVSVENHRTTDGEIRVLRSSGKGDQEEIKELD